MADGANFKLAVWNVLVAEMALHHGMGAPKTAKACKPKYSQLQTAYNTVTTLKGLSSFNWDDEKGMNIGIGEADAWKAYITKHDGAKMYTNKGFPLYHIMSALMPGLGKGTHAFRPSDQTQGASSVVSTMPPEPISDKETPVDTSAL
ncbi:hypothetical protein L208DRAFT_1257999 [Tricholoma matsutake]|nr:hypothetical protein L208DRAFT_1257999 [Tricholoma matsutake 945]